MLMAANFDGSKKSPTKYSKENTSSTVGNNAGSFDLNDDNFSSKLKSNIQRLKKLDESQQATSTNNDTEESNDQQAAQSHPQQLHRVPFDESNLRQLCSELNLKLLVESTQRTITRRDDNLQHEKGAEVFIGKLPRDVFEFDLLPLVKQYGELVEFRIMLDYSGYNRGYAFVTYKKRTEASKALKNLNNYEIKKGKLLGVCRSVDNCRLFVGGIPKTKKKHEILEEMKKVTDGVVDVIVYPSAADKSKNRGFAFVEYETHRSAAMSRRKLMPGKIQLWGQPIAVDWAEPEIDVDDDIMAQVKILYVRNLMLNTREEELERIFSEITGVATIERVKKIRDYAFVHFNTRENAAKALKQVNGSDIDGSIVEVTWAKPVDREAYAKYNKNTNKGLNGQEQVGQHGSTAAGTHAYGPAVYAMPIGVDGHAHGGAVTMTAQPILLGPNGIPLQSPVLVAQHAHHAPAQTPRAYHQRGHNYHQNHLRQLNHQHHHHQPAMGGGRSRPRGAGGIRAVGSRNYLANNRSQVPPQTSPTQIPYNPQSHHQHAQTHPAVNQAAAAAQHQTQQTHGAVGHQIVQQHNAFASLQALHVVNPQTTSSAATTQESMSTTSDNGQPNTTVPVTTTSAAPFILERQQSSDATTLLNSAAAAAGNPFNGGLLAPNVLNNGVLQMTTGGPGATQVFTYSTTANQQQPQASTTPQPLMYLPTFITPDESQFSQSQGQLIQQTAALPQAIRNFNHQYVVLPPVHPTQPHTTTVQQTQPMGNSPDDASDRF